MVSSAGAISVTEDRLWSTDPLPGGDQELTPNTRAKRKNDAKHKQLLTALHCDDVDGDHVCVFIVGFSRRKLSLKDLRLASAGSANASFVMVELPDLLQCVESQSRRVAASDGLGPPVSVQLCERLRRTFSTLSARSFLHRLTPHEPL